MNRGKSIKIGILFLSAAALFALASCYAPGAAEGEAGASATLNVKTLIQTSSGTLRVTGSGMSPISVSVAAGESAKSLEVPSGKARTITLTLTGASVTLAGSATVDLAAGENKTVTLTPTVSSSKIIIFDTMNYRLVQMDSMDGTGWKELGASSMNPAAAAADFMPAFVEFDSGGRMYFANISLVATTLPLGILRIPDFDHPVDYKEILSLSTIDVMGYIIDPGVNILYLVRSDGPGLWKMNLDTETSLSLVPSSDTEWDSGTYPNFEPGPMTVDDQGRVFLADVGLVHNILVVLDLSKPVGSRITYFDPAAYSGTIDFTKQGSPQDIRVVGGSVYVAYPFSGALGGKAIISFDLNLNPKASFGSVVSTPSAAGEFIFPFAFLRIPGNTVYVIDDDPASSGYDRVVSFDSMSGSNWKTYGSTGSGQGQFLFIQTP